MTHSQLKSHLEAVYGHGDKSRQVRRILLHNDGVGEQAVHFILQGLKVLAEADGDYLHIIEASGVEVRERAIEMAKSRYEHTMKMKKRGRKYKHPPFDLKMANIRHYPNVSQDGATLM